MSNLLQKKFPRLRFAGLATGGLFFGLLGIGWLVDSLSGDVYWGGYVSLVVFYSLMFFIGFAVSRQERHPEGQLRELLLAGRSLPLGVAVMTMAATWVGGGFINGTAESVAFDGLAWAQAPWGYALSLILGGLIFARPMRQRNYTTMLDPLEDRFGSKIAAILYLPALAGEIFWTAAILTALGTTFGFILNIEFNTAIIISAFVAIAYTSLGGLRAVAFTDVFQLIILLGGLYLVAFFVLPAGGFSDLFSRYREVMGDKAVPWPSLSWGELNLRWWDSALLLMFGGIAWHVYFQRVLSSQTVAIAQWLSIIAGVICFFAALPSVLIGMVYVTTDWESLGLLTLNDDQRAITLPFVMRHLAPPVLAMIGLGALAAAVMSSVDSSILSASSMGAWNVYRPLMSRPGRVLPLAGVVQKLIWIVGITAMLLALKIKSVYALWFLCSDFVYCILFAQLLTALFDKQANAIGSAAGLLIACLLRFGAGEAALGIPTWIHYPYPDQDGLTQFPFRTVSMLAGLFTIMIVSRLTHSLNPPQPLKTVST